MISTFLWTTLRRRSPVMDHGVVTDSAGASAAGMHDQGGVVVRESGDRQAAQTPTGSTGVSPTPRRLRAPRWLNGRLIAGIMLVLVSVIVGARVLTAADDSDTVWAAHADLAAGTIIADGDLRAVSVRLADSGDAYLLSSADPVGRVLSSPIRAGELLPRAILTETSTLVEIALPIAAGYVPPSLHRGQLVDVYALDVTPDSTAPESQTGTDAGTEAPGSRVSQIVRLVVEAAVVQLISGRTDGALSIGSSTVQVVISVEADQASEIFAAIAGQELALAVRSSPATPDQASSTPTAGRDSSTSTPPTPTD